MPFLAIVYLPDRQSADSMMSPDVLLPKGVKLVGVYEWPRKEQLTCKGFCATRKGMGWSRHRKGHMVCVVCGGRHVHTRRRFVGALLDYLGINLLDGGSTPPAFRNPEGWDARR